MTPKDFTVWFGPALEQVIRENLSDPDLITTDSSFKDGYAKGFKEATIMFVKQQLSELKKTA